MAGSFTLTILTPDKSFFSQPAQEIIFGTPEGRIGIQVGHMPMVAAVSEGTIEILVDGEWKTAAVSQGFAEIMGSQTDFFVDTVEWAEEIDTMRAREALMRAEMRLKSSEDRVQYVRAQAAMARALARLKAAETSGKPPIQR